MSDYSQTAFSALQSTSSAGNGTSVITNMVVINPVSQNSIPESVQEPLKLTLESYKASLSTVWPSIEAGNATHKVLNFGIRESNQLKLASKGLLSKEASEYMKLNSGFIEVRSPFFTLSRVTVY
jgi:hypothetical protein